MHRTDRLLLLAVGPLLGCGADTSEAPRGLARPVTVLELHEGAPRPERLFPGLVTPYRRTEIPFQVTGRVQRLIAVGDDVLGEQADREGNVLQAGTVLAELDPAPLQRALNRAEQRLESARLQLEAQVVQLEEVLPARLESARAQAAAAELSASYARDDVEALESAVSLAQTTVERNRELLPTGAVSDIAVRQSEAELQAQKSRLAQALTLVTTREREHDAAEAAVSELQGSLSLQRASNEAQEAGIRELEEAVLDARSDLEHCVLYAPFPGRVTSLHVGEGSFVKAGEPVVTLTMMNPIEAVVTVSADVEEELVVGTDAILYPMDGNAIAMDRGVRATLYQKRGVADANTRTFEVGLIAPNERRAVRGVSPELPRVPYVLPLFDNPLDLPGDAGLFTLTEAVGDPDGEAWVLRVEGLSQGARSAETLRGVLRASRVPVRLGERSIRVASFSLVELAEPNGLREGDLLVPFPTPALGEGFVVDDNRWLLRPGDVVQVSIEQSRLPSGYYVPVQAIRELDGRTSLFLIGEDDRAREVEVEVEESAGELRRVSAPELFEGAGIALKGAHFLQDGDTVVRVATAR